MNIHRVWVEEELRTEGLAYGSHPDGSYGKHRAMILLNGFAILLDDLDKEDMEQQIIDLRSSEGEG